MSASRIQALLFTTILIMTALPLTAAFYFLDSALQTSLNLGFNQHVVRLLEAGSQNLKTLKNVDPQNQERYRQQFEEIESLKHVYAQPDSLKHSILGSLKIYFGLGLIAAILVSVVLAITLSRRIARAYTTTFEELSRQRDKVRYLEEISSWQELAKVLAHEIKNPLTPIEVLITSLSKSYLGKTQAEFQEQLRQTQSMVSEELGHLKNIVSRFSEFAKLPQVQLTEENLTEIVRQHSKAIATTFENAIFQFDDGNSEVRARIDATLFRQVLMNIVRNGIEANPGRKVRFDIGVASADDAIRITIANDGEPVPATLAGRIFDPYISGKSGKDNMGLGLAIVKKIVIEHGGDIAYLERSGRPAFVITLPKAS